jgi:ligand-binding SRPBCC domain-containing protein
VEYCAFASARFEFPGNLCTSITWKGRQFRDVQISGPFRRWDHTHRMTPEGSDSYYLKDRVQYELPLRVVDDLVGYPFVRKKLEKTVSLSSSCHCQSDGQRSQRHLLSIASNYFNQA